MIIDQFNTRNIGKMNLDHPMFNFIVNMNKNQYQTHYDTNIFRFKKNELITITIILLA